MRIMKTGFVNLIIQIIQKIWLFVHKSDIHISLLNAELVDFKYFCQ